MTVGDPLLRKAKWFRVCVGIGIAVLLVASIRLGFHSGHFDDDKAEVAQLIQEFHLQSNAAEFGRIYDRASLSFRNVITKKQWTDKMQENRERYGLFVRPISSELNVIVGAPVEIRAAMKSECQKGRATELFIFTREGNSIELSAYGIYPGPSAK